MSTAAARNHDLRMVLLVVLIFALGVCRKFGGIVELHGGCCGGNGPWCLVRLVKSRFRHQKVLFLDLDLAVDVLDVFIEDTL